MLVIKSAHLALLRMARLRRRCADAVGTAGVALVGADSNDGAGEVATSSAFENEKMSILEKVAIYRTF